MARALFITILTLSLFAGCSLTPKKFDRKPASLNFIGDCQNLIAHILLSLDFPIDIERSKRAKLNLESDYLNLIEKSKKYIGMPRHKFKVRNLKKDLININNKLRYINAFLAKKEQQYQTVALVDGYIGETMGAQDMQSQMGKVVRYLTAKEKQKFLIKIDKKGLFRDSKEHLINSDNGLFIMDELGNIYLVDNVSNHFKDENFNHASFLAALAVASAGITTIKGGKVLILNNKSEHYLPPLEIFQQVITELKARNADLSGVNIVLN